MMRCLEDGRNRFQLKKDYSVNEDSSRFAGHTDMRELFVQGL